jgi:hypothetical protein
MSQTDAAYAKIAVITAHPILSAQNAQLDTPTLTQLAIVPVPMVTTKLIAPTALPAMSYAQLAQAQPPIAQSAHSPDLISATCSPPLA